ncbi:MAG: hypothetical protein CL398_09865 [Acidiferrobacteraceae bacterium]|nr:hypothetical protein [Acidiferrobacteraceae bacterium]
MEHCNLGIRNKLTSKIFLKFGLIIFDYDGVLVDSQDTIIRSSNEFCSRHGIQKQVTHEMLAQLDPATFPNIARKAHIPKAMIPEYAKYLSHKLRTTPDSTPIFTGVSKMLSGLEKYYTMAIVSANHITVIKERMQIAGLSNHFNIVFGSEHGSSKADHIRLALERTGCRRKRTWMIGDTVSDIDSALSVGIHALAATWGWQSKSFLKSRRPEKLFDRPSDIEDYLITLAKQYS